MVGGLVDEGARVRWYDHHQWDDGVREALEEHGVDFHLDEDECAASLIEREVDHEFNDHVQDLVEATKDIDLWIRDDLPRSEHLNIWAEIAEPEEYIDTVLEHGLTFRTLPRSASTNASPTSRNSKPWPSRRRPSTRSVSTASRRRTSATAARR